MRYMDITMNDTISPFHAGERAVQARFGLQEKMDLIGRKIIRPYMPDQHRTFFAQLPTFFLGWRDDDGWPWATVLAGTPGFLSTPSDTELRIDTLPATGDPFRDALRKGRRLGGLGLEFETRRRNRMNGFVQSLDENGFSLTVEQSFGNCPQYIQTRSTIAQPTETQPASAEIFGELEPADIEVIQAADTFFIASSAGDGDGTAATGADVSHRGGLPGFVRVGADGAIEFPDYAGNRQFQTLGNIEATGRAGLLFIDFTKGDLLRVTGEAEIIWEGPTVDALPGAERVVRIIPNKGHRLKGALPLRWEFNEYSPSFAPFAT